MNILALLQIFQELSSEILVQKAKKTHHDTLSGHRRAQRVTKFLNAFPLCFFVYFVVKKNLGFGLSELENSISYRYSPNAQSYSSHAEHDGASNHAWYFSLDEKRRRLQNNTAFLQHKHPLDKGSLSFFQAVLTRLQELSFRKV